MKVGVIGNCQARGMATSLYALAGPFDLIVEIVHIHKAEESIERLRSCDIIFGQPRGDRLASFDGKLVVAFPQASFTGLMPDCIHAARQPGPLGAYHSGLVIAAFLEGLNERRAVRLFNRYVFGALGYRSHYTVARNAFLSFCGDLGYDLAAFIDGCAGDFMHTVNHPRMTMQFEIASQAARRAGFSVRQCQIPADPLARCPAWPIYPGLMNGAGTYGFRANPETVLDLKGFVEASYQAYRSTPPQSLSPIIEKARDFIKREVVR